MFEPVNHILAALGLPWMSLDAMDRRGDEILAAIRRKRVLVKDTPHSVEIEQVGGHAPPVPTVSAHIDSPRSGQAGRYTVTTVTELIKWLGTMFGAVGRSSFSPGHGIAILKKAIDLGLPMTEIERKLAWARVPMSERFQWCRWVELLDRIDHLPLGDERINETAVPMPDIGCEVPGSDLLVCLDLDPHETFVVAHQPRFRVVVYRPAAKTSKDLVVWVSTPIVNAEQVIGHPYVSPLAKLLGDNGVVRKVVADHLLSAFHCQVKGITVPPVSSRESHLPKQFALRWVSSRDEGNN